MNKENKLAKSCHKSIDLKNLMNTQPDTAAFSNSDQKENTNNKRGNQSFEGNQRRFSFFSKTSFATQSSFMFGTKIFNSTIGGKSAPKINIQSIFKNKAYLYLDESLAHTFDDLLDKGYEMVATKKEERDILKQQELIMFQQVQELEKEIVPLINQAAQSKEQIQIQEEMKNKYEGEIYVYKKELEEITNKINQRIDEIQENHRSLTNNIKNLELQNNQIRSEININKASHKQSINELEKQIKRINQENINLVIKLNESKNQFEQKKMTLAERLRKMENKSKMFIGILKH